MQAEFTFDDRLVPLLPKARRRRRLVVYFNGPQSAKHLIECLLIPHTEIGGLQANGTAEPLGYLVQDADRISIDCVEVFPMPDEPRFMLDGHLGRLSAALRMLGFDTAYQSDVQDETLATQSAREGRILLTRDRRLLMRRLVTAGCLIRGLDPQQQLGQVIDRFGLRDWWRPFSRCVHCNERLVSIEKDAVRNQLKPLTRLYFDDFRMCPQCRQVFWRGSHYENMHQRLSSLNALGSIAL